MATTGQDFDRIIDLKSDNAYSGYFDNTKKNRLIREATNKAIDRKVKDNDRIQVQDDLFGIYKSNVTFTPNGSNEVELATSGSGITDYYHMMNLKAQYAIQITGNYISSATNTSPIVITMYSDCNLRNGEQVSISGVTTNTNTNGIRYVRRITNSKFALYSDVNLETPVTGNGIYSGTSGTIYRVIYNYAKDLHSGRKFSVLNAPTPQAPFYEIADAVVKIYPLTRPCTEVTIDYISLPTYIDVNDSTIDIEGIYSPRFIDYLADFVCLLMGQETRDQGLIIDTSQNLNEG